MQLVVGTVISFLLLTVLDGGAVAYSIGDVDPKALRGVWRLTSLDEEGLPFERNRQRRGRGGGLFPTTPSIASGDPKTIWKLRGFLPMKEFTTYPKTSIHNEENGGDDESSSLPIPSPPRKQTEIFIKIKDDHTFEQCQALTFSDGIDNEVTIEERLEREVSKRERESFAWKGTWAFVDGNLILAADRPEKKPYSFYGGSSNDDDDMKDGDVRAIEVDTILVGKVAVQSEESLTDNPAVAALDDDSTSLSSTPSSSSSSSTTQPRKGTIDVYLSIPRGKIKTGKFMYPKTHPSFFEQPIFTPTTKGRFELRQVLGEYNAATPNKGDALVELFRKSDLVGKRFYLSTFPLPKRKKKFERWDKTELKFVQGEYEPTAKEKEDESLKPGENMQVMAVELFVNNTFSTVFGLGSSTILRGKWNIIGDKRDQLWMMVSRFGFGRSVSGSTFSEGTSLTQNDEKAFWGKIIEVKDGSGNKDSHEAGDSSHLGSIKIEVEGSVIVGFGLEPEPIGRFKMIEIDDVLEDDEEEEDEEEYEEMSDEAVIENANNLDSIVRTVDSDVQGNTDQFDFPGAFE
jgi:hypothetical protein